MNNQEPNFNEIGGHALAELVKSGLRASSSKIIRILKFPFVLIVNLWRKSPWEVRKRVIPDSGTGRSKLTVVSDSVLWKLDDVMNYRGGKSYFAVGGPLCPEHFSPLWFALHMNDGFGEKKPITDTHLIDNSEDSTRLRRVMYCPDDRTIFIPQLPQKISEMRSLAKSKLQGIYNRNQLNN
ncbi:MAG: hypothetical protein HOF01_11530 [Chloroflexi bacterium]|jgi:hypothetical protein|nr:hypothetical protein [Chloroflexota bacterium]